MSKKVFRAEDEDFEVTVVNGRISTELINLIDVSNPDGEMQSAVSYMPLKSILDNFYALANEEMFCELMDALDPESEDFKIAKKIWERNEIY